MRSHKAQHKFTYQIPAVDGDDAWTVLDLVRSKEIRNDREERGETRLYLFDFVKLIIECGKFEVILTSIKRPLNVWLIVTLPNLTTKSPTSKRDPFDSI